jgi:hypothetical protein
MLLLTRSVTPATVGLTRLWPREVLYSLVRQTPAFSRQPKALRIDPTRVPRIQVRLSLTVTSLRFGIFRMISSTSSRPAEAERRTTPR